MKLPSEIPIQVLMVDDSHEKLLALESVLSGPGLEIVKAHSGAEALRKLLLQDFALILLDVRMPSMGGLEVARLVRERKKSRATPIIFITSIDADESEVVEGYSLGAVDFIFSPVQPEILKAKVGVFVELFRATQVIQAYAHDLESTNSLLGLKSRELQKSRESFQNIVEFNAQGIILFDEDGSIKYANRSAKYFLQDLEDFRKGRFPFSRTDNGKEMEIALPNPKATSTILQLWVGESRWEGQNACLAVLRDITDKKKLEEQLWQSQKLESVGRLAGGIAHDFNNLLTAINGYCSLSINSLEETHPLQKNLTEILHAGERAAILTSQLLSYSRKQMLLPRPLNLNQVVLKMENILRRLIGEHIELETNLDPELGMVTVDPVRMEQCIMNLVVNSRDAMPKGGQITLKTRMVDWRPQAGSEPSHPAGRYTELSVIDTGLGMEKYTLENLFEPFFTTKDVGQGSGLGLSMAYGFLKQSGGFIEVDSELGKGANFRLYLPQALGQSEPEPQPVTVPEIVTGGKEQILVVEDESSVLSYTQAILSKKGYGVDTANNGCEALAKVDSEDLKFDLLVTDLIMPQMGGMDLASILTKRFPDLKVLYISGNTEEELSRFANGNHVAAFLQKPFSPKLLAKKVRAILDAPKSEAKQVDY